MIWVGANASSLLNIVGICCDIVGAILIASEVVNQFHGEKYKRGPAYPPGIGPVAPPPPRETEEYSAWDRAKFKYMKWGLFFLIVGFLLQIGANLVQITAHAT